jgi:hypothetical protein
MLNPEKNSIQKLIELAGSVSSEEHELSLKEWERVEKALTESAAPGATEAIQNKIQDIKFSQSFMSELFKKK